MNRFELARPTTLAQARALLAEKSGSVLKAGGIDLLDHMKERLLEPPRVVDLRSIPGLDRIEVAADGSLRIGPLATLARVGSHRGVRQSHPALAQACATAASPQIRNVATIGGNLLQRPRCWYYRLESYECLKKGGEVCFAAVGENRYHSIFGDGPCYALHPSNAAVALVAYGASFVCEGGEVREYLRDDAGRLVHTPGAKEARTVPAGEFFIPPSADPGRENDLSPGEVLTEIRVPSAAGFKSAYHDVCERAGFDWPLVSLAAAVKSEGGVVREARLVLGAVAPIPWRSTRAEQALVGKELDEAAADAAARAATLGAAPLEGNAYKVGLVETLVRRTLQSLA